MAGFRDNVAAFLRANPNRWLPATAFEPHGGRQAWRTRLAECRTQLGMRVDNRVRVVRSGSRLVKISEYRFIPADLLDMVPR